MTSPVAAQATVKIKVEGIHANCVKSVTTQLQQLGITSATVDLATETATVECRADVNPVELVDHLTAAGFPSQLQNYEAKTISDTKVQSPIHWTLMGFFVLVVCFNLCLNAQVLTVGLAYFYNPEWWNVHVWLVRGYSGLSLILLAWVYRITVPRRVRSLTTSLPLLLGLQFLTIHLKSPVPLGVVHPLVGFTLFSASTTLVHRTFHIVFPQSNPAIASKVLQK